MGEIRVFIPDELHADILELAKKEELRLPEEVIYLLTKAVNSQKNAPMKIRDLSKERAGLYEVGASQEGR